MSYYISDKGYYYGFDSNKNKYKRIPEDVFFKTIENLENTHKWIKKSSNSKTDFWESENKEWGLTLWKDSGDMHIKRKKNKGGHNTEMGCFNGEWRITYKRKDYKNQMFDYVFSWLSKYGDHYNFFSCKK